MKISEIGGVFLVGISLLSPAMAENFASDLIGSWHYTEDQCTDHFMFTNDRFKSISNKETIEATIKIIPLPDDSATQLQVDREVTFDSLGPDCAGTDKNDTGRKDARFIKFNHEKDRYLVCLDQTGKKCWGPILKDQG